MAIQNCMVSEGGFIDWVEPFVISSWSRRPRLVSSSASVPVV